jgi:O-antigen/teichoic acid export membrane protein
MGSYLAAMTDERSTRRRENIGTGFIVVATALSAIAVLAFQALGSRTLGTSDFAPIAVLWTLMFLVYTVLQLPAEQHITRALVVTRSGVDLARIRRDALAAYAAALTIGVVFVWVTLDRFFEGDARYIAVTAAIMVTRSIMATARGTVAGHRRFGAYGGTIAAEALALLVLGIAAAAADASAIVFASVMALSPLAALLVNPFSHAEGPPLDEELVAQPGSFLAWLIAATAASQVIIAGGPIAVSFVGGSAASVSIFFTSFALLRGPVTSAYNLVARILPDFTAIAHGTDPRRLWAWAPRLTIGGIALGVLGAIGAGLFLQPIVSAIYGEAFVPPDLAAALGGAGVGIGLGALFATQMYSATAKGSWLACGWGLGLVASILTLVLAPLEPIDLVALAFVVGEGTGLLMLGIVMPRMIARREHRVHRTTT